MMNQTLKPLYFAVPLAFEAHAIAQDQSQPTQRSYLKALAVYAVEFYLRCLGIGADFAQGDWRDPWMSKLIDVADVCLPQGKLECCVVLPNAEVLQISPDAWGDRIAYVAVQMDRSLKSATLLGFIPNPAIDLPLSQLRSIDQLPDFLSQFAQQNLPMNRSFINLRNWLEGAFETGWQSLESALEMNQLQAIAVRGEERHEISVRQAKLIDLASIWAIDRSCCRWQLR
ncbi:MAG: DUF1822 family protein [Leptolyngbyaceae cyanobacterium SM1_3_5]|nr:DUF1822 family protein [Leptolyngbyaceae cyanobacterium SM1_3_5]